MKKYFILPVLIVMSLCVVRPAHANVYVIASVASQWAGLTQKDLLALYMGRGRGVDASAEVIVLDLPRDHPVRDEFYTSLTSMSPAQVNSYWSRLIFAGKILPPAMVPSEQLMLDALPRNPKAIGYLSKPPTEPGVKILLVLKSL